tara:strand:- start:335 stop:523 length:189 start_codon:yes stop_codon:yes gene_type:complete
MHIKICKTAKNQYGKAQAFTVKINGRKYPRIYQGWYFTSKKNTAVELAMKEYYFREGTLTTE